MARSHSQTMLLCGMLAFSYHVDFSAQLLLLADVFGGGKVMSSGAKLTFGVLIAGLVLVDFDVVIDVDVEAADTNADTVGAVGAASCKHAAEVLPLLLLALYEVAVKVELALDATEWL